MNNITQSIDDFINNKLGALLFGGFSIVFSGIYYMFKLIKEKLLFNRVNNTKILNILSIIVLIVINIGINILNKNIALNFEIRGFYTFSDMIGSNIVFLIYIFILIVLGMVYKNEKEKIIDKFLNIRLIDHNGNTPKVKNYMKSKDGIFEIKIKTNITYHEITKYTDRLEHIFDMRLYNIDIIKRQQFVLVFVEEYVYEELTRKETIDFKNPELSLSERVKGVFDYLGMDISGIEVIERIISTTIYFNSSIDIMKMNHILPEIRARLKNQSLILKISNIYQYDYMFQLIKNIKQITYMKVLAEIYQELNNCDIPLLLGIDMNGEIKFIDLKDTVHYLVGGTTGSGKTNNIHNVICTMLLSNKNIAMFMIDVKKDLNCYSNIDNVLRIEADDIDKVIKLLELLKAEMIHRNELYTEFRKCDSLEQYNRLSGDDLPYIVIFIEEYAELETRCNDVQWETIQEIIKSLTQLSRSTGFRVFISTQSPRKEVITPLIKTNCPNRQCFMVASITESTVMLDNKEAKNISQVGQYIHRLNGKDEYLQAVYIPENEHMMIIDYLEARNIKKLDNEQQKITLDKKPVLKRIK